MVRLTSSALTLLVLVSSVRADDVGRRPIDGAIIAGAVAASLAPMAIPLRDHELWKTQLFGSLDEFAMPQFSLRAGLLSDVLVGLAVAAPVVYLTGSTIEDADGDRLVLYGETLAIDLAVVQIVKYLVQRPRPYLYNHRPDAVRFAQAAGDDAWRSFYSSHAALSFGAAVAGAYLLSEETERATSRGIAWAAGMAVAAATSNLRVRGGRHFYSDVVIGALVGSAIGYAVPALHERGASHLPSGRDAALAGLGVLAGVAISELLPMEDPLKPAPPYALLIDQVELGPIALAGGGAGLAIRGRVRSRGLGRVPLSRNPPSAGPDPAR